jgi:DNA polymerase-3 subunit gamma/tau
LRIMAFRPGVVIDDNVKAEQLQDVDASPRTAGEDGAPVKKHLEKRPSAPGDGEAAAPDQTGTSGESVVSTAASAPGDFRLTHLEADNWHQLFALLGLKGIVHNIASHCALVRCEGNTLQFVLDEAHTALYNEGHSDKLRMALENYFAVPVSVTLEAGRVPGETPAIREARLAEARQAEAVESIESDARLQALISRFDGELDRSSIHPTDS